MKKTILAVFIVLLSVVSCWATSNTLLISEFIARGPTTIGVAGNDEFIEVFNASATAIDLGLYKLDGANASGTIGNRYTWSPGTMLPAGKRFLLANAASSTYFSLADATYGTGISDSSQLAIRRQSDDSVIDAVAWGVITVYAFGNTDTTTGFPTSGTNTTSRERLPFGINTTDTDINLNDFAKQPIPNPQSLGIPQLSNMTRLPYVPYAGQTATVGAIIIATGGHTISGATVFWSLNSVSQTPLPMTSISSVYAAIIPGQIQGSIVQYSINAFDNAANSVAVSSGYVVGTTQIARIRLEDANGVPIYSGLAARAVGIATVPSSASFVNKNLSIFMQDNSGVLGASGLNIFSRTTSITINLGDTLLVEGAITNFNGSLELEVSTTVNQGLISVVGSGTAPDPILLPSMSLLKEDYEGLLITIADVYSTYTAPTTGTSTYSMYRGGFPSYTGTLNVITTTNLNGATPPSYPTRITGIINQSDSSSPYLEYYRVVPRSTSDFSDTLVVNSEIDFTTHPGQVIKLTVSGGTGPYTWSINSAGGATGTLDSFTGSSVNFTVGDAEGTVYLAVHDSSGTPLLGSTGIIMATPTSAPIYIEPKPAIKVR
ncbi:MAG: lamin tail domain-containing protein [bacterium]